METNRDNEPNETPAPPKLVAALRRTQSARVFVPRSVNEAVLREAKKRLTPEEMRPRYRFAWMTFATACLVVCVSAVWLLRSNLPFAPGQTYLREDVNHDGHVDILDAYLLARLIESHEKIPRSADINGDGRLDRRDAEAIARQAVKLEKGGRS